VKKYQANKEAKSSVTMRVSVFLGSASFTDSDIEAHNQADRAMADIFKLYFCARYQQGAFIRGFMFQCLYSSHLIRGNNVGVLPALFLCVLVQAAYFVYFLSKGVQGFSFFRGIEPVTDFMGMYIYLIFKKQGIATGKAGDFHDLVWRKDGRGIRTLYIGQYQLYSPSGFSGSAASISRRAGSVSRNQLHQVAT